MSRRKVIRDAQGQKVGTIDDGPGFLGGLLGLAWWAVLWFGWVTWACLLVIFGVPALAVEGLVVAVAKRDPGAGWKATLARGEWAVERVWTPSFRWLQAQQPF